MGINRLTKTFLVTGVVGFIGSYLSKRLLEQGYDVIGIDNINDYYDVNLKNARLENLILFDNFTFIKEDISNKEAIMKIFEEYKPMLLLTWLLKPGSDTPLRTQMCTFKVISSDFSIF